MPLAADRDMQWLYKIVRLVARRSSIGGIGPDQHGPYALMPRCSVPHSPSVAAPHFRPPPRALRTKPPVRVRLRIRALRESHRGSQGRDANRCSPSSVRQRSWIVSRFVGGNLDRGEAAAPNRRVDSPCARPYRSNTESRIGLASKSRRFPKAQPCIAGMNSNCRH
jgi:hypothetical protein